MAGLSVITPGEEPALPADKSPQPPLSFPEQPAGQGPAPSPGRPPGEPLPGSQPQPPGDGRRRGQRGRPQRGAPPGRPPAPGTQQRALAALVLGLLGIFGLLSVSDLLGLGNMRRCIFLVACSLIVGALALWLGLSALVRSRRAAAGRPRGAISAIVLGGIGILFSVLLLVTFAVLWKQLSAYAHCMAGANTLAAQHACQSQLTRSVNAGLRSAR